MLKNEGVLLGIWLPRFGQKGVKQGPESEFFYKKTGQGTRPVMLVNNISRFLSDFFGKAILIAFTILLWNTDRPGNESWETILAAMSIDIVGEQYSPKSLYGWPLFSACFYINILY